MNSGKLDFKISFEIKELDINIDNLDIDFKVKRSSRNEPDLAYIYLWNLDETTYQSILQKNAQINLYLTIGNNDPIRFFVGEIDINTICRKPLLNKYKNTPDICTYFKIIDSKRAYLNSLININYRERVSSTKIILDCLDSMGLKANHLENSIPEKFYDSYKAKGYPHVILRKICEALDINLIIQNGILKGANGAYITSSPHIEELNVYNSSLPIFQNLQEIIFYANPIPALNPLDIIYCNFSTLNGLYMISSIDFYGNNYDKICTSKLTIGL